MAEMPSSRAMHGAKNCTLSPGCDPSHVVRNQRGCQVEIRTTIHAITGIATASFLLASTTLAYGQEGEAVEEVEGIVVIGARRAIRSVSDTSTPIEVIQSEDLRQAGVSDTSSLLRNVIPSWNVNAQPISDAATIVRPANLRGLGSDQILIFLNGKRRHRAAVISFVGNGQSESTHGPDVSVIPPIALKRVEVLKDSASAQYGSDAIAGVINFVLKDSPEGGVVETQWGQTYEGDGEEYRVSANAGVPIKGAGFLNVSTEFREAEPTVRSVQRTDAQDLIEAGHRSIRQPYAQVWGRPETRDDYKIFANFGLESGLYAFGNYAQREVEGGFFFRDPTNRNGVFTVGEGSGREYLVVDRGDDDGDPMTCASVPVRGNVIDDLENIYNNLGAATREDCFSFLERFPGGYTPSFGGEAKDVAGSIGFRNKLNSGLGYDVSLTMGRHRVDHFISDTINPSLGPESPTSFAIGAYIQEERTFNADFTYPIKVEIFESPLNLAAGFEWREEKFKITQGDTASWEAGPYRDRGFFVGSHGFAGFSPESVGSWDRDNIAAYLDLEADVRDDLTLSVAGRVEYFETFKSTHDFKIAVLKRLNDWFNLRASVNSGFRVPTVGQENVVKVSTSFNDRGLVQLGTFPVSRPLPQALGAKPLKPEESIALSTGFVIDLPRSSFSLDLYRIEIDGRIGRSQKFIRSTYLEGGTSPDRNLVAAFDSNNIEEVDFYGNGFNTRTQGLDIVATLDLTEEIPAFERGTTDFVFAFNYTKVDVQDADPNFIGSYEERKIEESLPRYRFHGTLSHDRETWRSFVRLNYFGPYTEFHTDSESLEINPGSEYTIDAEVGWRIGNGFELSVGATNLFNNFPDRNVYSGSRGSKYPESAPGGIDGGFYYTRLQYSW